MTVKSIIDIEVNSEKFKEFSANFDKYQAALKKMPGAWAAADDTVKSTSNSFADMTAALLAQQELLKKTASVEKDIGKAATLNARTWHDMAKDSTVFARQIGSATKSLLKWSAVSGVVSGLLGAGGLFGIDRMASGAAARYKTSRGLGVTTAEQEAFQITYSPALSDPTGFLGNIQNISNNPALQYGVGGTVAQLAKQGLDPAQIGAKILPDALKTFLGTGGNQQLFDATGLGNLASYQDFVRYAGMTDEQRSGMSGDFAGRTQQLALSPDVQQAWTSFTQQMETAGTQINNTFIAGLAPLAPQLSRLSQDFTKLVTAFLKSDDLQKWIGDVDEGFKTLAEWFGADKKGNDTDAGGPTSAHSLSNPNTGKAATAGLLLGYRYGGFGGAALGALAGVAAANAPPDPNAAKYPPTWGGLGKALNAVITGAPAGSGASPSWSHNPGNLKIPGSNSFQQFGSDEDGLRAMAAQIRRDESKHGLTTLSQLIGDPKWGWAPASDGNDIKSYVADVSKRSGIDPLARLDPNNTDQLSRLISAMSHHENSRNNFSPATVNVVITNNTGAQVAVTGSQLAVPQ